MEDTNINQNNQVQTPVSFADRILAKLPDFDPSWPVETQAQWFEAVQKVMGMAKPETTN